MNYPLRVILDILGLPEEEFPRMLRLTQELFGDGDPDFQRSGEDDQAMAVIMDVITLFTGLNAERREHPTTDLATVIANGEIDGKPLEDMDTYGYYLIVATAGHDTTSNAVGGGMEALLEHPAELEKLHGRPVADRRRRRRDRALGEPGEALHAHRPAGLHARRRPGDHARATGCCSRTSRPTATSGSFDDPFTFDVTRPDSDKHLGFGFGRHYCLGAHLARLEIRALFKELIPRLEHIELAGATGPDRLGPGERPQAAPGHLQLQELSRSPCGPGRSRRTPPAYDMQRRPEGVRAGGGPR